MTDYYQNFIDIKSIKSKMTDITHNYADKVFHGASKFYNKWEHKRKDLIWLVNVYIKLMYQNDYQSASNYQYITVSVKFGSGDATVRFYKDGWFNIIYK